MNEFSGTLFSWKIDGLCFFFSNFNDNPVNFETLTKICIVTSNYHLITSELLKNAIICITCGMHDKCKNSKNRFKTAKYDHGSKMDKINEKI